MTTDRKVVKVGFSKLYNLPAIQKSLDFKVSNGDAKRHEPAKMPSEKRVDGIIKACRNTLN